ncbi:MAG: M23 family metallopeptidase [Bacteroidota bacterium]
MEEKTGWWQKWREKLQHQFRLVIMRDETFEEVRSLKLNMLNIYLLLSSVFVVVSVLVYCLIAFTPLKRYLALPASPGDNKATLALQKEVDSLNQALVDWELYIQGQKNRLLDRVTTAEDIDLPATQSSTSSTEQNVEPSPIDDQLREEVSFDQIGQNLRDGTSQAPLRSGVRLEQLFFVVPVSGEISARFMPDKNHYGVDVLAPKNTAVKSALDGYVIFSDWTLETGNTIGVQHSNNIITFYKHNSSLLREVGSFVKAGEAIAIIGNTGTMTDGPHLHFELWYNGKAVNPQDYISF